MQFLFLFLPSFASVLEFAGVAKMSSHVILQYNVLVFDDTHNTWTNICVKMIIIRFIGPRDKKIKDPKEIKSKRLEQRQFTITG